jgi:hypothetical protein
MIASGYTNGSRHGVWRSLEFALLKQERLFVILVKAGSRYRGVCRFVKLPDSPFSIAWVFAGMKACSGIPRSCLGPPRNFYRKGSWPCPGGLLQRAGFFREWIGHVALH